MSIKLLERFQELSALADKGEEAFEPILRLRSDRTKVPEDLRAWVVDVLKAKETYSDLPDPTSAVNQLIELCESRPVDWEETIAKIRGVISDIRASAWNPFVGSDDASQRFVLLFALYSAHRVHAGLKSDELHEVFRSDRRTTDRWAKWAIEYDLAKRGTSTDGARLLLLTTRGVDIVEQKLTELQSKADSEVNISPKNKPSDIASYDIVVVCALHTPELEKLLTTGREQWLELGAHVDDPQTYYTSTYVTAAGKPLRVVAGAPNQMGLTASAILATKMILRFRPKLVAMVGIAAGVREASQGFGDILAAEHTLDYGSGKHSSDGQRTEFRPDPKPIPIHPRLLARLKVWERERFELDDIYRKWPARRPRTQLRIGVGPLASGSAVLNTRGPVEEILTHWRKLIGIEMEAYGVHCASQNAVDPAPMFLCLKSICDFAHEKDDDWQDYAAYTSAELCYRFLIAEWDRLFLEQQPSNATI